MALPDEGYNGRAKGDTANDYATLEEMREVVSGYATVMSQNFEEAEEDIEFIHGEQWDPSIEQERTDKDQPCMTFPKLTQFIDQVVGEEQQQQPSIKIRAADGYTAEKKVKTHGKKEIDLATTYAGLIRQIERSSHARISYDNGYEGAVSWGWGNWRIINRYVGDSFDQELAIAPIWDPFAVSWDPSATEYTREDSMNCVIRAPVPKAEFKRRWPGATAADFEFSQGDAIHWVHDDQVFLAEWFHKEPHKYPLCLLSDGRLVKGDDVAKVKDELAKTSGVTVVGERQHQGWKVVWRLASGSETLEQHEFQSSYIPVVPVWGRMLYRKGRFEYRGLIRNSKDEQRAYNYARTAIIETVALAPKAPYVAAVESIEGYEHIWQTANTEPHGYLPYKAVRTADGSPIPPPQRQPGGVNVAGLIEMVQLSEAGMKSSIGIYDPSLGQRSNETSGKAIAARQAQGDRLTYPFVGNMAKSIEYTGRILLDMIPRHYSQRRIIRILHDDETDDTVEINQEIRDEQTGKTVLLNDLSTGRFDVAVDVGPSYLTRRIEAAAALNDLIAAIPAAGPLLADIAVRNLDMPGADSAAERLRRGLVPPQVLESGDGSDLPPEAMAKVQEAQQQMAMMQQQIQELAKQIEQLGTRADSAEKRADKAEIELAKERAISAVKAEQDKLKDMQSSIERDRESESAGQRPQTDYAEQFGEIAETLSAQAEAINTLTAVVQELKKAA